MIDVYTEVGEAFDNKNYKLVIKLVRDALEVSNFGFNMNLLYKYAYSLIMSYKLKEGLRVFNIIAKNDIKAEMLSTVAFILGKIENKQVIKLYIKDYLKRGYELQPGLVVYLKSSEGIQNGDSNPRNNIRYPFMIWKVEEDKIYAFPIREYINHGFYLSAYKYLKEREFTVHPKLAIFNRDNIFKVDIQIDKSDYNHILRDLYKRSCVFGTINNYTKNYFVSELEKNLAISVEDVIVLYDISNHTCKYYYVVSIDEKAKIYKAVAISHLNGNIYIKDNEIIEIPMSIYIVEKVSISEDNRKRLKAEAVDLEEINRKRSKITLKRSILTKIQKFLDFFSKES